MIFFELLFDIIAGTKNKKLLKKILNIKHAISKLIGDTIDEPYWITWYGAYDINPKHLVFWVCVHADKTKERLKRDNFLQEKIYSFFKKYRYPSEAISQVYIGYESQETVNRVSDGDWHIHFQ